MNRTTAARRLHFLTLVPWLALCVAPAVQAQTRPLNDTGITWSGHATSGNASTCDSGDPTGQDCHYGRDKAAADGTLTKVGASTPNNGVANGFDYTKIANDGSVLPANATLGSNPGDWACTRDNVTGLIWEVKTTSGLRNQAHTYTWFMTGSPDGYDGVSGGNWWACETPGRCDTEKYTQDVNTAGLCGASDWRMPTVKELVSIVDFGRLNPAIDPTYFPDTPAVGDSRDLGFWSSSRYAGSSNNVLYVMFYDGVVHNWYFPRNYSSIHVRLVRAGQ